MIFGFLTLAVGVVISLVAAYYSITGLTAIFAAAVVPIMVMGAALEIGKIVAAVWLKLYWHKAKWTYKLYLVPAVAFLMVLTSMGIFGFLSKAHSDQSLVSGDVQSKIAIYDEKIKIERENISNDQSLIKQMDAAVNGVISTGDQEIKLRDGSTQIRSAAERSLQIRRAQARDRANLTKQIEQAQARIVTLQEESAPIRAEVRKVEAEVGPIKYIAALVYGDNPDTNLLESAVRWVIILIVIVFDPLALVLILAAQQSIRWSREEQQNTPAPAISNNDQNVINKVTILHESDETVKSESEDQNNQDAEQPIVEQHPYLNAPFKHFNDLRPMVQAVVLKTTQDAKTQSIESNLVVTNGNAADNLSIEDKTDIDTIQNPKLEEANVVNSIIAVNTTVPPTAINESNNKSVVAKVPETAPPRKAALPEIPATMDVKKHQSALIADNAPTGNVKTGFGTQFPANASKGDTFLRVDHLPNRLYKHNGVKWIEIDRSASESYVNSNGYVEFLVERLRTGEYDIDQLTTREQDLVEEYLNKVNNGKNT